MSISNLLDIASSGIAAQRLAMDVTGENIANVNTEGYSRQQVVMESKAQVTSINGFGIGGGVQVQAVQRSYDGMLQNQIVDGNSSYQQDLTRQSALSEVEPLFNELNSNGLGKAMDDFFASWQDLSTNAGGTSERQALLTKSQVLVDSFHQISSNLSSIAQTADGNLTGISSEVTGQAKSLAQINAQIVATQYNGGSVNELLDQRDLLLQKIAGKVGITSTIASDGTATVSLSGGETLVSGSQYATVYTKANAATPPANDIFITEVGNPPAPPNPGGDAKVTATIGGPGNSMGEIGGTLQVRDSIVPGYLASLNEMASKLVSAVNTQHASGYALDGSTGNNFFAAGTTAATIALAAGLTPTKIAAAFPTASDPVPTSAGNNVNALKMADIKGTSFSFTSGSATLDGFYNGLTGKVGMDSQEAQNSTAQGAAFMKQLNALRSSNSGVSLDEELTNLTKYQQAFQGSARVLNAATAMLDTILSLAQ